MAKRFNESLIFDQDTYVIRVPNATGIADRFFQKAQETLAKLEFPNLDSSLEDFKTGGLIFNKEVTRMLSVSPSKSAFDDFGFYLRAQAFGNVVVFSKFETIDIGFLDLFKKDMQYAVNRRERIRDNCKNMAQREEFSAITRLGVYMFYDALEVIDPDLDKERIKDKLKN